MNDNSEDNIKAIEGIRLYANDKITLEELNILSNTIKTNDGQSDRPDHADIIRIHYATNLYSTNYIVVNWGNDCKNCSKIDECEDYIGCDKPYLNKVKEIFIKHFC